jgi:hypothetical protein
MIYLQHRLLPEDQVKAIREWIRTPACQAFTNYLAACAAVQTAKAGNKLVDGDESDEIEAKRFADEARKYLGAHEIMLQLIDPTFKFEVANLLPKPLST